VQKLDLCSFRCSHHCVILKCFVIKRSWILLWSHLLIFLRAFLSPLGSWFGTLFYVDTVGMRDLSSPRVVQSTSCLVLELAYPWVVQYPVCVCVCVCLLWLIVTCRCTSVFVFTAADAWCWNEQHAVADAWSKSSTSHRWRFSSLRYCATTLICWLQN